MQKSGHAELLLLLITAIWGLTFPLMELVVGEISPSVFVFYRFLIAGVLMFPWVILMGYKTDRTTFLGACVLGILNSAIYIFQTTGLQTIDAPRAAFITGSSVMIVPFLLPLLRLGYPKWSDLFFAGICMMGLFILTGANLKNLTSGDGFVFLGACCSAASIVYLQWITPRTRHARLLVFYQIVFALPATILLSHGQSFAPVLIPKVLVVTLFCGAAATTFAIFIQTKYQQFTSASKAALIYAMEPVFAAAVSPFINGTELSRSTLIGGGIMLFSIGLQDGIKLYQASQKRRLLIQRSAQ